MSLSSSKVAPEAEPEGKQEAESASEKREPEGGPGPDPRSQWDPGTGPESEPPASSRQESERLLESSQGQKPELGWASGQSSEPPAASEQESQPRPASARGDPPLSESQSGNQLPERSRCHTDCLEAPLSRAFAWLGWMVGSHPWIFLLAPMVLTAALGTGFVYLPKDEEEDLEEQYTPIGSPAKAERRFVQAHFTINDSHRFSASRKSVDVNFASVLVVSNTASLLEQETLSEISKLDEAVRALYVTQENGTEIHYDEVCAMDQGRCVPSNPLLAVWQANNNLNLKNITFPISTQAGQPLYLANLLGGVVLGEKIGTNQFLLETKAMRLLYFLETEVREDNEHSKLWLIHFLNEFSKMQKSLALKKIQVPGAGIYRVARRKWEG